jgi:hypothetical protein
MKKIWIIILLITFLTPAVVYAQSSDQSSSQGSAQSGGEGYNPGYNTLPIILTLIMFYLISYLLYDNKIIRKRIYKQIWSIVLLGSFLISGITGILLILTTDYGIIFNLNFDLQFWHVEIGIILAVVLLFHIHIHFKRFKKILTTLNQKSLIKSIVFTNSSKSTGLVT